MALLYLKASLKARVSHLSLRLNGTSGNHSQIVMKQSWLSALLKGTSVMTECQTNTLLLTTPELGSSVLDRPATTSYNFF